jgi:hypothetical protein
MGKQGQFVAAVKTDFFTEKAGGYGDTNWRLRDSHVYGFTGLRVWN